MDDLDDMRVASGSDDELNIIQSVQKDLGHEDYIKSAPLFSHSLLKLRTDTPCL